MLRTHVGPLQAEPKSDNKKFVKCCNLSGREMQQHKLSRTITVTVNIYLCLFLKVSDPDTANHHSIDLGLCEPSKIHSNSDIACKMQEYRIKDISWIIKFNALPWRKTMSEITF